MTVCFLLKGEPFREVLLGYKKIGFGAEKWAGFGEKVEPGETILEAAQRELMEECSVSVPMDKLQLAGEVTFLFPAKPDWNQRVHVFLTDNWEGTPCESNEMRPQWFPIGAVPYAQMWDDARHWLPQVFAEQSVHLEITFAPDNATVQKVTPHVSSDELSLVTV